MRRATMSKLFDDPILNSPYAYPDKHWELVDGQPTEQITGRWAFAELCDVYEMELDIDEKIEPAVNELIDRFATITASEGA